jgi:hypothetical protein
MICCQVYFYLVKSTFRFWILQGKKILNIPIQVELAKILSS